MKSKKIICTILSLVMLIALLATAALAVAPPPEETISGTGHFYPYYCTGNGVNVRTGPGTTYASYGYLNYYETFWHQMDANKNGFGYGKTGGDTAISVAYGGEIRSWVSTQYLNWRDMI